MNIHRIPIHILAAIGATAVIAPLAGAERKADRDRTESPPKQGAPAKAQASALSTSPMAVVPDPIFRATDQRLKTIEDLRGQPIIGVGSQELGIVHDFIVDTETGKVVYAVAKTGAGDSVRLIQQSSLRPAERGFASELDREAFNNLEALTEAQLDSTRAAPVPVQSQRLSSAIETKSTSATPATTPAIGILPTNADSVSAAATAAAAHPDAVTPATTQPVEVTAAPSSGLGLEPPQQETHLVRASQLKEKALHRDGQPLGRIQGVGLDLNEGKALAVVQLAGQNAQARAAYYVPLTRLKFGAGEAAVTTTLARADFERAQPLPRPEAVQARTPADRDSNLSPTGRPGSERPTDKTANPPARE